MIYTVVKIIIKKSKHQKLNVIDNKRVNKRITCNVMVCTCTR
jgi:hypothetical protein